MMRGTLEIMIEGKQVTRRGRLQLRAPREEEEQVDGEGPRHRQSDVERHERPCEPPLRRAVPAAESQEGSEKVPRRFPLPHAPRLSRRAAAGEGCEPSW